MQVRLILLSGSRVGDEVRVEEEAVLGRNPDCQLRLDDAGVSRRHARVRVDSDGIWLEDLGSSNGTKIGGRRVQEVRVEDGDVFELGHVKVRLKVVHEAGAADAPAAGFEDLDLDAFDEASAPAPAPAAPSRPAPVAPAVEIRPKADAPSPELSQVVEKTSSSRGGYVPRVPASRRGGVLGEDLSQQSGAPKILLIAVLVLLAAAVFWFVFSSMR